MVPEIVRAFSRYVGVQGTCLDLFSLEQYVAFHGKLPPADWREATAEDLQRSAGGEAPDIIVSSPPCKGWSGLVTEERSRSPKYQALNALALRGIGLAIEAWADDPPSFWLLENVPRLVSRGAALLGAIVGMLEAAGYAVTYTVPDLGEIGNLAQSRKRLHLVARHREKVPVCIFEPPKRPLRAVGEVLGPLPLPGHPAGGFLHRLPRLEWRTWVRLALIPAGGDWRDLNKLTVEDGVLRDYRLEPGTYWHPGVLGVNEWDGPASTITGRGGTTNGNHAVADPRVGDDWNHGALGVRSWEEHAAAVTTNGRPTAGAHAVADPRAPYTGSYGQLGVQKWDRPAGTVTGQSSPGQGPISVADPRACYGPGTHTNIERVTPWDRPAGAVTSSNRPGSGAAVVADPRHPGCPPDGADFAGAGHYGVLGWEETAGAVTAAAQHDNGRWSVADPRTGFGEGTHGNVHRVMPWDRPAGTVTGSRTPGSGAGVVADPRLEGIRHNNVYRLIAWRSPSVAVTAGQSPCSGGIAVQDPRLGWHAGASTSKMRVAPWDEPGRTVTGSDRPGSGAAAVADPRSPIELPELVLPTLDDRGVWTIQALDGTWHRPMSVLERAALQGLVDPESIEEFTAAVKGMTVSATSEVVGNAIPPPAMAETLRAAGLAILLSRAGETWALGSTPVWVKPFRAAVLLGGAT